MRCSIEVYPGIRRTYVIVPTILVGHGIAFAALLATRLPYSRLSLFLGLVLHIAWLYIHYVGLDRRVRRRIAVVPSGGVEMLADVPGVAWKWLKQPQLADARGCEAIVADFSADLPPQWEEFLAEAATGGRLVYQHKQLFESLTGRVRLEHLSENTFGSLLPSRGYFHLKSVIDLIVAVLVLPLALLIIAAAALAIRVETPGSPFFNQKRVGHQGREFTMFKLRSMRSSRIDCPREAATTLDDDDRITRVGRVLRKYRIDELPQIFNILKGEMSWIGPRPEASALSGWYRSEIPFYVYRHVVRPGVSGWAQVNQGHVATIHEVHHKLQFDFYYIKYFSPWLDLLILLRTIKTMVVGFGSK
jgi:lipopolysaccharide/colanic/teichoic acid biosynthesis glycosyltransferase